MSQKKNIDDATVLDQALLVISELGPDNFTLAAIGKAVGLAPATLLQRFGSKQQLLIQAAKQANVKLKQDLDALKKQELPWDEELLILLIGLPEGFGSRQDIANSLGLLKLDMIDPELHPIARQLFYDLRERIQELLKRGKVPNLEQTTWELDALRHGLVIQWTLSGKGNLHAWMKQGFQNYLERLKK